MSTDATTTVAGGDGVGSGGTSGGASGGIGYRVELEAYAGPMDLLLYLVKKDEVDLADIPIARLTEQYLEYLRVIEAIDVDRAGEFLVMAATLLEIKSRMMVPLVAEQQAAINARPRNGEEDTTDEEGESDDTGETSGGEGGDPRRELVEQLRAYKAIRDAADALAERGEAWSQRAASARHLSAEAPEDEAEARDVELDDAHVMDLCSAFARLLDSIGNPSTHAVTVDDTPIGLHAEDVLDLLGSAEAGRLSLAEVFAGRTGKSQMIGLFLATLELVRQRKVRVVVGGEAGEGGSTAGTADQIALEVTPEEEWMENEEAG
ncbi:MAG: segregation/condensation protein A [Planctomycetota bacterium]